MADKIDDILSSWGAGRNALLYGPPATGKTRLISELFQALNTPPESSPGHPLRPERHGDPVQPAGAGDHDPAADQGGVDDVPPVVRVRGLRAGTAAPRSPLTARDFSRGPASFSTPRSNSQIPSPSTSRS